MGQKKKHPLNIWRDIERCSVQRLDIVFEGKTIVGIHHSDMEDVVNDLENLIKRLTTYKKEMELVYYQKKPKHRSMLATYIYLIHDENTGLYKIGRSIDPKLRERTLQAEQPKYNLIWVSPLTKCENEKLLHKEYSKLRVRGEWFALSVDDVESIKKYDYGT